MRLAQVRESSLIANVPLRVYEVLNLLDLNEYSEQDIIIDIGCGEFATLEKLLNTCSSFTILALDIDKKALIKIKNESLTNAHFIMADAKALPFRTICADKVFALELVEHLPEGIELTFFKEVNRVLKEKGYFILSVPNYSVFIINMLDPHWLLGHRHYKLGILKEMLALSGFNVRKVRILGGILDALCYLIYLPHHFFWSHFLKKEEPPLLFSVVIPKLITIDYSRLGIYGTHIFLKAIKA